MNSFQSGLTLPRNSKFKLVSTLRFAVINEVNYTH